jgi:hypothetical protein
LGEYVVKSLRQLVEDVQTFVKWMNQCALIRKNYNSSSYRGNYKGVHKGGQKRSGSRYYEQNQSYKKKNYRSNKSKKGGTFISNARDINNTITVNNYHQLPITINKSPTKGTIRVHKSDALYADASTVVAIHSGENGSEILQNILESNKEGMVRVTGTARTESHNVMQNKKKQKLELDEDLFLKTTSILPGHFQVNRFMRDQGIANKHKNDLIIYLETCIDATEMQKTCVREFEHIFLN